MNDRVRFETKGPVAWIHMDDGKVNAINGPLMDGILGALDRAEQEEARAVVLAGRLGYFSAGLDLKTLPTLDPPGLKRVLLQFGELTTRLLSFPRPLVALSAGHALAGGAVMLLAADWRVGCQGPFQYGLNEVSAAITMPTVICEMARHILDPRWFYRSVAHGERYTVQEALAAGYLTEACPADQVFARAEAAATRLAALPDPAYRVTKERLRKPIIESFADDSLERELSAAFSGMGMS
jgi:enoyl-CoA hydratase